MSHIKTQLSKNQFIPPTTGFYPNTRSMRLFRVRYIKKPQQTLWDDVTSLSSQ
jgi:hypothetical protein